ncbi:ATPase [Rothia nasimurium]|uniref:ATPase n=1 Tax=Rothia nasimurium TaxID=85336 RepID=UPI003BA1EE83
MDTRFLLSPAYLVSVTALIVGAILSGTSLMVIGWIIFIIGLALNAMALVVLANREQLYKAQRVGVIPKASTSPAPEAKDAGK